MKPREEHTLDTLKSYGLVTRGWWWRGATVGFFMGVSAGAAIIAVFAWLTGNL